MGKAALAVAGIGALVIALGALAYLNWGWVDAFIGLAGVIKMMSGLFAGNFGDILRWFAGKEQGKPTDWGLIGKIGGWFKPTPQPADQPLGLGGVHPLQQSCARPPGSRQVIQVNSSFDVDGRRLANAVSHHVALGAEIINSAAMFDGRMTPMSVDMGVP